MKNFAHSFIQRPIVYKKQGLLFKNMKFQGAPTRAEFIFSSEILNRCSPFRRRRAQCFWYLRSGTHNWRFLIPLDLRVTLENITFKLNRSVVVSFQKLFWKNLKICFDYWITNTKNIINSVIRESLLSWEILFWSIRQGLCSRNSKISLSLEFTKLYGLEIL